MRNIYIYALSFLTFVILGAVFGIRTAEAYDTTLRPDSTGLIRIDDGLFVDASDTLRIPAGATVEFGDFGSIFVKGRLEIGLNEGWATGTADNVDLVKGVKILSSKSNAPISTKGGTTLVFNANFSGPQFITAFSGSALLISSSTFESAAASPVILIYSSSTLDISESIIKSKGPGESSNVPLGSALVQVFSQSNATMTKVKLESPNTVSALQSYNGSTIRIDDSSIRNCFTGITAFNATRIEGVGNSISCSEQEFTAYNNSSVALSPRVTKKCCARIVFVPGLQGSRLYRKGIGGIFENQLWEPNRLGDAEKIFLNAKGESLLKGIYVKDIIERTNIAGAYGSGPLSDWLSDSIYAGFISYLKKLKEDHLIDGYSVFPYDWRFTPNESDISGLTAEIQKQADMASNGQVILISHSYGGFLAKAALYVLAADDQKNLIQAAVHAAMPETGAPQAIFAGLHGYRQEILGGAILNAATAIRLAANMPSAHFLVPSLYFNAPIDLVFMNKKTKAASHYPNLGTSTGSVSATSSDPYSLVRVYEWLKQSIKKADTDAGQKKLSPVLQRMPAPPSGIVALAAGQERDGRYRESAFIEDAIRSYSIIGTDLPTPVGMRYEYMPCIPLPANAVFELSTCSNPSAMNKVVEYSKRGDGVVVFDGKDRRSGKDIVLSLADSNMRSKTAIGHSNFMESKDVQQAISSIIRTTNVSGPVDPDDNASGSGPAPINPDNPWLNTNKVHALSISGFVDGRIGISANQSVDTSDASSSIRIVTLDQNAKTQTIIAAPEALAYTTVSQSDDGWSFGSAVPYETVSLRSLADQSVSISFTEQSEIAGSTHSDSIGADALSRIEIHDTESFQNIPVGYGSMLTADMQYVTPVPGRLLSIDIDADGVGDMVLAGDADSDSDPGSPASSSPGSGTTPSPQAPENIPSYDEKKIAALDSLNAARISASRLEVSALMRSTVSTVARAENYVRKGNPALAVMLIMKKEQWLAGISAQYADRMARLQKGMETRILPGFRTEKERQKKQAEIVKIQAYMRDLARIKILLMQVGQKAVDLLTQ